MSTETSAEHTTVNHTTDAKPKGTLKKMKSKVRRTLNKLKGGKKNKNKNKKGVNDTQPRDTTSHQADLADKDRVEGDDSTTKKPVLSDASHMQRHDPLDSHSSHDSHSTHDSLSSHSSHDDTTHKVDDHHEKLGARSAKNSEPLGKHDGIDGPYSQDAQPVLESPSRQHDIPTRASDDSSVIDGRKKDVLQGAPQLPDPYQKKHAVLAGIHDIPSRRDSGLASQGSSSQGSSSSMTSSQAPMSSQGHISQGSLSSQGPMSSEAAMASQGPYSSQAQGPISSQAPISQGPHVSERDSRSTADQERIQRELEKQRLELEKEKAEKLRLLQEKEVFEAAATNLLQVKGQLVGDMLQMQMDMDKIQMEKMQLEAERVKREQQQIELQQERAQLQMDKDKLLKEKRILEQPGVVQKLTGAVTGTVKGVFGAPGSTEISEHAAENAEIDRTVLGLEKPVESKGMISQITDRVKSMMPSSSSGPTPAELSAYEAGLVKGGLRTDDETYLHPEVEQKGMLASLTDKVKGVLPTSMIPASIIGTGTSTSTSTSTVPSEQQGVLSKISQLVFGTDSSVTSASSASTVDGVDHTLCTQGLESARPSKIDMDIADNREAVPLAQPISQPISQADRRSDMIPQADQTSTVIPQQTSSKAKSVGRSPKKSPKKVGRRASKKNVYRAKSKTDVPQTE